MSRELTDGTLTGTRTLTKRDLNPLPLPLGYEGFRTDGRIRTDMHTGLNRAALPFSLRQRTG